MSATDHIATAPHPVPGQLALTLRTAPEDTVEVAKAKTVTATPLTKESSPTDGSGPSPDTLDGLPLTLTVSEAAVVLRVSRTTAYKLADEWRTSGGRSGLPVVHLGRRLVVRRVDLAALVGLSPDGER